MTAGIVVAGRFRLESMAGQGGMGEVWKAVDVETGRDVALKRMIEVGATSDRFVREAGLLARVQHAALVGHVDHGVDANGPWLAMAWVEGETLASRLAREGLSLGDTLAIVRRIAGALAALHAQGIVHRDLKPSNVILEGGRPDAAVLLDLGVARASGQTRGLTATNTILGTIGYMAPEQALSDRTVGPAADVFSLGCLMFECLTGAPVYPGDNVITIIARLLSEKPRRVRSLRSDVPEALDALVASMLAREPVLRPRDGSALLEELVTLEVSSSALTQVAPPLVLALTHDEQALALAAVVDLGAVEGGALTISEDTLAGEMDRVCRAARAAGGDAVALDARTALMIADGRGTVADRASVAASLARSVVAALPSARVGLAAGLARSGERIVAGELLERAARLARGARSGIIALDAVVHDLLDARFEIDESRCLGAPRQSVGRRVLGKAVPFVGREKEMAVLEATVAESIEESSPRALLVVARPGTGKSRLAHEFVETRLRRRSDVTTLEARAESAAAGTVLAVIRGLVRAAADLSPHPFVGDHAVLRDYVRSLPTVMAPERLADFLGDLVGAPCPGEPGVELASARGDPELMSRWMRRSVCEWLGAETARKPVVLVVEDLHWSDEATMVHLGEALRTLTDRALVVLALARPEVDALFREPWRNLGKLELGGLGARAAERIARAVLGTDADGRAVARVIERADGNPYFLEELVRFAAQGRGDELPANVLAVLHARLAELEPELRRILRAASVLGERFTAEGAAAVAGSGAGSLRAALDSLIRVELLERSGEGGYAFRHALAREATYATLAEADRKAAHARAAEWLSHQPDPSPRAMMAHYEAAGATDRAIAWLVTATVQSFEMGADDEAFALADKGLGLGASGIDEGRLHAICAARGVWKIDYAAAVSSGRSALARLPVTHPDWFTAAGSLIFASSAIGDLASAGEVVGRWLAEAPPMQGERKAYVALFGVVLGLTTAGMREPIEAVLAAATPPRPGTAGEAYIELLHAEIAFYVHGRLGEGLRRAARAREIAARSGDAMGVACADMCLGGAAIECLSIEDGTAGLDALVREHAQNAFRVALDWFALHRAGSLGRVDDEGRDALRRCARSADVFLAENARRYLWAELVRLERAEELDAELAAYAPVLAFSRTSAAIARAWVLFFRGEPVGALRSLEEAEGLAAASALTWTWESLYACRAEAHLALGDGAGAANAVAAGLDRVAQTLDGVDDALRAAAERHVDPVRRLRGLATRVPLPS